MTLREKQSLFARHVARLIDRAFELGFEVTFGETWRSPAQARLNAQRGMGIARSLHGDRLAIDLNLFRDGKYLTESEDHRPLGEWWEQQHDLARWGGAFGDGNHYSFLHEGRK